MNANISTVRIKLPIKQRNKGIITILLLVSLGIILVDEGDRAALSRRHELLPGHFCALAQCVGLGREFAEHVALEHDGRLPEDAGDDAVVVVGAAEFGDLPCFVEVASVFVGQELAFCKERKERKKMEEWVGAGKERERVTLQLRHGLEQTRHMLASSMRRR